jgi:hypothetical protein
MNGDVAPPTLNLEHCVEVSVEPGTFTALLPEGKIKVK